MLQLEVFATALSIFFSLIGRVENVDRYGFRRDRILERAIEIDLLVMNVRRHSTASLEMLEYN